MDLLFVFLFGLIIGSFLNVVGLRLNSGLSLNGRSQCPHCGRVLSPLELVPLLGFFILKGRCRECKSKISWQYPLIEFFTGIVFLSLYHLQLPLLLTIILAVVFSLYIAILIYDARHKIIPDLLVYIAIIVSLGFRLFLWQSSSLLDWFSGPLLFAFFGLIWLMSHGRAMGFGDAKLALSVGFLLGSLGISGIILAFWIGSVAGVALIVSTQLRSLFAHGKRITMKSEIPFAPFIILGAWLSLIFHINLLHVSFF